MKQNWVKYKYTKGTSTPKGGELAQSVKRPSVEPKIPGSTLTQADD